MLPGNGRGTPGRRSWHVRARMTMISCVVAALGLGVSAPAAMADPPTDAQHAQIAQEIATERCANLPKITGLGNVDPKKLCESMIVGNVDPNSNPRGVTMACKASLASMGAIGAGLSRIPQVVKACAGVMSKILTPAQVEYLNRVNDNVANAASKLQCVTESPNTLDCIAQQFNVWLAGGVTQLWSVMSGLLTDDTVAIGVFDHWRNPDVLSLYSTIGGLSALLLLVFLLVSLLASLVRMDLRPVGSALVGIATWAVFWVGGVVLALAGLRASDELANLLAGAPDQAGRTALSRASDKWVEWIRYFSDASRGALPKGVPHPAYDAGTLAALLIIGFLLVAIGAAALALLMRNVAVLVMLIFLPLVLAGRAGPAFTRSWLPRMLATFATLLLAKPALVAAARLGAAVIKVPKAGGTHGPGMWESVVGAAIILVVALIPGAIYKFSGVMPGAQGGNAPRAQASYSERSAQSVQASMDMHRMILQRNSPQARPLVSGGGGAMGLASAGGRGRFAGALAGASGPIGLALGAVSMGGGAGESVGRFAAGQAATAGGVFGDVDGPHVPHSTVPRFGPGMRRQQPQGGVAPHQEQAEHQPEDRGREHADLRVMRPDNGGGGGNAQALAGRQPLVIPGEVVPNHPGDAATAGGGHTGMSSTGSHTASDRGSASGGRALPSPPPPPAASPADHGGSAGGSTSGGTKE